MPPEAGAQRAVIPLAVCRAKHALENARAAGPFSLARSLAHARRWLALSDSLSHALATAVAVSLGVVRAACDGEVVMRVW